MRLCFTLWLFVSLAAQAAVVRPLSEPRQGEIYEFAITELPAVSNPYDPTQADLTTVWRSPSGQTNRIHGFWMQNYRRTLINGRETVSTLGTAEWRVRFLAQEAGEHALEVLFNGVAQFSTNLLFTAGTQAATVGITSNKQFFTTNSEPLLLNGANVCWHDQRGTYDYSDWFPAMARARENFARLWMAPWAFGIEALPGTLTRYSQDKAWQLDFVFNLARTNGIYLMLCFDYHGMFETEPDFWGGNNNWTNNPYAQVRGGPCASPNDFFVNATAKTAYQKRLRYLIARYGAYPNLLAWQFFNEIDNVYRLLNPASVATWHKQMAAYVKTNDPYRHLITTSLTSLSNRSEIWSLPELDFTIFHSYGMPEPATGLATVMNNLRSQYNKPAMLGEYGTDFRGWRRAENDPYLRGWRQGIWGGLMGGSVGSGMSWWWQDTHRENLYNVYSNVSSFISRIASAQPNATRLMSFQTSGAPPTTVGELAPGGAPFNSTLTPNNTWGWKGAGRLALVNPDTASRGGATFNTFFHGSAHSTLRNPFVVSAWFTNNALLTMHLNSVSDGSRLVVRINGQQVLSRLLANKDGGYQVNNEYNEDITLQIPAGKQLVEITNTGADWFYLDWVRLDQILPSTYANNWKPSPVATGQRGENESWVYVVNPAINWPSGSHLAEPPPLPDRNLVLNFWSPGKFHAFWYDGRTGAFLGETTADTENGLLRFVLPEFREDAVGRIVGPARISLQKTSSGTWLEIGGSPRSRFSLESSSDLAAWEPIVVPPTNKHLLQFSEAQRFFRALEQP